MDFAWCVLLFYFLCRLKSKYTCFLILACINITVSTALFANNSCILFPNGKLFTISLALKSTPSSVNKDPTPKLNAEIRPDYPHYGTKDTENPSMMSPKPDPF